MGEESRPNEKNNNTTDPFKPSLPPGMGIYYYWESGFELVLSYLSGVPHHTVHTKSLLPRYYYVLQVS